MRETTRRGVLAGAASILYPLWAAHAFARGVVDLSYYGAKQDGTSDDTHALMTALRDTAAKRVALRLEGKCCFTGELVLPPFSAIVGKDLLTCGLVHMGDGDGVSVIATCYLDNFSISGRKRFDADRLRSRIGALFGVHGPMNSNSPPLTGVTIGRLHIQDTDLMTAAAFVNVSNLRVDHLSFEDCWGHALYIAGARDCNFETVVAANIGNLAKEGARVGAGIAIFPESDPRKSPAKWYSPGGVLPTQGISFRDVQISRCTDTAVYVHGDPDSDMVRDIVFKDIVIDRSGHDGFKVRKNARSVSVQTLHATRIGLRGVSIAEHAEQVTIGKAMISDVGYDAVGDILGRPSAYDGTTVGRTISTRPAGIVLFSTKAVRFDRAEVHRVNSANLDELSGFGIWIKDAQGVQIDCSLSQCARSPIRLSHVKDFDLAVGAESCTPACEATIEVVDDNSGPIENGRIRFKRTPAEGRTVMVKASCDGLNIENSSHIYAPAGVVGITANGAPLQLQDAP